MMKRYTAALFLFLLSFSSIVCAQPFVEAKLMGQLGNQMFQIATATSLALDHGAVAVFPDLVNCKEWNIPLNHKVMFSGLNTVRNRPIRTRYYDHNMPYKPIPYSPNMYIEGYFQCEKYFSKHRKEILELFAPSEEICNYLTTTYAEILSHPCTVSIHHRSYLKEDPTQHYHPTQPKEYYQKAMSYYPEDALFVVCSNDIPWCKANFTDVPRNIVFIDKDPRYPDCYDLYLMSMCSHNIICNSTFSWWSAYLNTNPSKIVIAPHRWFAKGAPADSSDVIPKSWVSLKL